MVFVRMTEHRTSLRSQKAKQPLLAVVLHGRDDRARTCDLLVPNQTL
jgi:hypothetical protein